MSQRKSAWASHPGKGLYGLYFVLTTMVRFPLLALYYAFPSNRPVRTWSFKAAIFSSITKILFRFQANIELKTPFDLKPGKEKDNFQNIPPAPKHLLTEPLRDERIEPSTIGALWIPAIYEAPANDNSRVLLHFHGGAFVVLSPRNPFAQYGPKMMCSQLPAAAALSVQYRLASNDNGAYPAALQDAVAAYWFLLDTKKIHPSRIVFSGDSSGGNVVIGLLRYISQHPDILPHPQGALLSSPWVNLTDKGCTVEGNPREKTDYLSTEFLHWGTRSYIPPGLSSENEWITPLHHPFSTKCPIWVQTGTAEVFHDDIVKWAQEMQSVQGNRVEVFEQPEAMHSIFAIADNVDMSEVALEGAERARSFLQSAQADT